MTRRELWRGGRRDGRPWMVLAVGFLLVGPGSCGAWAQVQNPGARAATLLPPDAPLMATPGRSLVVPLQVEVAAGFHINADKPTFDYLIPTRLEWTSTEFKLLRVEYPKPEKRTFSFSPDAPLDVYQGTVRIQSRFQAPRQAAAGKLPLRGKLRYQACDDKACYPPVTLPVEVPVEIKKKPKA